MNSPRIAPSRLSSSSTFGCFSATAPSKAAASRRTPKGACSRLQLADKRDIHVHTEANCASGSGDCAGGRADANRSCRRRLCERDERVATNDGAREHFRRACGKSVWGEQRAVTGEVAGSAAAAGVSILDGVGVHAAAGSAADQAGAPILARAAIFVVERAGPELAAAVRAENDGRVVDRRFAAVRVRHEYLSGFWIVAGFRAFAGRAAGKVFSFVGSGGRRCGGSEGGDGSGGAG